MPATEMVRDRQGNIIPKYKIVNDAEHQWDPMEQSYKPVDASNSMRSQFVQAGQSLWDKLRGNSNQGQ